MKKYLNISQLVVNPDNYRFDPVDTQQQAIDEMLEKKGSEIINLAQHILEHGFDKSKEIRILKKGQNYIVLDGNRRITAAKCLINPSLIKNQVLKIKFNKILKSGKIPSSKIDCYIYENEAEAALWIKLDHTGKNEGIGQDPWGPAEQDRFDYKFGGKKSPATQLVDLYTSKTGKEVNTKALKISTINRILSNPESRSYLGIEISLGKISLLADEQEIVTRLGNLFKKVIGDNVPVAEVYTTRQGVEFMKKLYTEKPQLLQIKLPLIPLGKSKITRRKVLPKSGTRTHLIPTGCTLRIKSTKINNIYRELRDDLILDDTPRSTPNAVGVLFRVFLEVSLDYFAEKICGKIFSNNDTINQKIDFVTSWMEKNNLASDQQLKNIRTTSSAKMTDILHIQRFHEYVHSGTIQPDSSSLKAKWGNLQEFFEILWLELEKQGK